MTDYKLVPVEPTPEMLEAGEYAQYTGCYVSGIYADMLAAAPAVQGEPVGYIRRSALELMKKDELGVRANIIKEPRYPDCVALYIAPQPAEQQPAPNVAGLVEAAEAALGEIETIMHEAYNSAYPICCGRSGYECCGSPDPEWDEADQRMMDRLAPHQRALREALAAHRSQGGEK